MHDRRFLHPSRGLTIVELLAVVALLGVLAAVLIPRAIEPIGEAKRGACFLNRGEIELQAQLWRRNTGSWPAASLSDVGGDLSYFPSGLPTCPVDGTTYTIDTTTGQVIGHSH